MTANDDRFDETPWEAAPGADPNDWELAAAACELAMLADENAALAELPAAIGGRIVGEAARYLPHPRAVIVRPASTDGADGRPKVMLAGWWVAACLAVAVAWLGWTRSRDDVPRAGVAPPSAEALTPAERRRRLLAEDSEAVTIAWKAGDDPSIAAVAGEGPGRDLGDVVWSPNRQQGFMRIRGLAANDPAVEQYQLWIFDAGRNEAHPVDGGVFDVTAGQGDGEVVVAMDPRLPIGRATLFAVTVEKPGGVVVSSRERLPLLAAVP